MQGKAFRLLRGLAPVMLVVVFTLLFVPSTQAAIPGRATFPLLGPGAYYLALGDSLAFGFQPDIDFLHGYTDDFNNDLKKHGVKNYANLGCPGETSTTMIEGGCSRSYLRKYAYTGSQLQAAVHYLQQYAGQVSPVTLDIGANDLLPDFDISTCTVSPRLTSDLATLNTNLTRIILPRLLTALTVKGRVTGDILFMNNYDPYQNICPNSKSYIAKINGDLAQDVQTTGHVILVDIASTFASSGGDSPVICRYTWICSLFKDVHSNDAGYQAIAQAFEGAAGY